MLVQRAHHLGARSVWGRVECGKDPDTSSLSAFWAEAGLILTEYILDQIQGVDAPDILARRPFVMRDYPCAARLRRSGAAVGQGRPTRHGRRAHHVFFVSVLADDGRDIII